LDAGVGMKKIVIHEVGPRDGLQIEKKLVPMEKKVDWILHMARSGVDVVQIGSFVHPAKVPQMAETDAIFRFVGELGEKPAGVKFSGLVLNEKGLDRALACGVDVICMGASASDTHSRKNTGMGTDEAVETVIAMANATVAAGREVQVSVQSAFGCGYEGPVPEDRVRSIVRRYLDAGVSRISLADTAGHANPLQVERLFGSILDADPTIELACHFHDTYGMAMANCWTALEAGVTAFEAAFGGLGGCPFTALSGGNVATEDLVHMLQSAGLRHDIAIDRIISVAKDAEDFFRRELPGVIHRTGVIPTTAAPVLSS
jgi:hydroxymethylglutaryl-CoA lyase